MGFGLLFGLFAPSEKNSKNLTPLKKIPADAHGTYLIECKFESISYFTRHRDMVVYIRLLDIY